MCKKDPEKRTQSFAQIERALGNAELTESNFEPAELQVYRDFANEIQKAVTKIESGMKYINDASRIENDLTNVYRSEKRRMVTALRLRAFALIPAAIIRLNP